jgi:hypothetical protein
LEHGTRHTSKGNDGKNCSMGIDLFNLKKYWKILKKIQNFRTHQTQNTICNPSLKHSNLSRVLVTNNKEVSAYQRKSVPWSTGEQTSLRSARALTIS